jgi:hypothetical protein
MPRRTEEAGIGACGHCGRFGPCIKEASYPEPLCIECFDLLEEEGIPYQAECVVCGAEDQFWRWPDDEEREDLRCADCDEE